MVVWETGKDRAKARYERWWLGKLGKLPWGVKYRRIVKIELFGPPSFVYGVVRVTFDDGETVNPGGPSAFKPNKSDIDIKQE